MKHKENIGVAIWVTFLVIMFIAVSYIAQNHLDFFKNYIKDTFLSMIIYVLILIVSVVLAPIDLAFLIPVAISFWGWFITALLTLLGWTLGSAVAFVLARRYGAPLLRRAVSLEKIYKYEKFMPQHHIFLGIISLRLAIPIDLISYALGLFTSIKFWPYFFATLIGFAPLAFFLSYLGTLPITLQIIGFGILLVIVLLEILFFRERYNKEMKSDR
jgi:uncharacterized membrane protein YdjX (TVP38/TMEM64 family)